MKTLILILAVLTLTACGHNSGVVYYSQPKTSPAVPAGVLCPPGVGTRGAVCYCLDTVDSETITCVP